MSKKISNEDASLERLKLRQRGELRTQLVDIVKMGIKYSFWAFLVYAIYQTLITFAGKVTSADINVAGKLIVKGFDDYSWLQYIIGPGGLIYGLNERRLRKRKTESLANRNTDLENRLDSNRTSSGILPTGETREGD